MYDFYSTHIRKLTYEESLDESNKTVKSHL